MIRRPPRSTLSSSSAASDVYKRQAIGWLKRRGWAVIETVNGNSLLSPRPEDELTEERLLQDVKVMKRFTLRDLSVKQKQQSELLRNLLSATSCGYIRSHHMRSP